MLSKHQDLPPEVTYRNQMCIRDRFYPEIADIWVESIRNIEIAELTCMNLFQHLPYEMCIRDRKYTLLKFMVDTLNPPRIGMKSAAVSKSSASETFWRR